MEQIDLADLTFNFEDYFDRFRRGELTEQESKEFTARAIGLFCRSFFESRGDTSALPRWVVNYIAEQMWKVLGGERWDDALPMPWSERSSLFKKRTDERAADIYSAVHNALHARPELAVTELLQEQADKHCVSFETARADYYRMKLSFDNGTDFRPFLNLD